MKIGVAGAGGRMGAMLIEAVIADPDLELAAAFDVPGSAIFGRELAGVEATADVAAAVSVSDAVIDFTQPEGTLSHLRACVAARKAMVIGTTGFSESGRGAIAEAAKVIPIVMSPNFAVGVNAIFSLAASAARILGDAYDVEILEVHHRHKVDAPSGTALKLGEVIAKSLGRDLQQNSVFGRRGETGARPQKQIGFHAIRAGDIVGEHTVLFAGPGERIELTVRSQSRMTYALGALRAAKFLEGRPPGLYDMADVLGLSV